MNLRRLIILLISTAMLSGLLLLGRLLFQYLSDDLMPEGTLLQHIQAAPLAWGYSLASGLFFISFLIWLPSQLPVWRLVPAFRQLDSSLLDNDPELSRGFYGEALSFRLKYGEKRFVRQIVGRFDFFYDYHNDALLWLNDIVNRTEHGTVPRELILTSICSGQIGRIYSGVYYGDGLASSIINPNDPVFLHARMDRIEIWTATTAAPIETLERQHLELEQGQAFAEYSSCYLNGLQKSTHQTLHLELRCLTNNNDDSSIPEQMQAFQAWIQDLTNIAPKLNQNNFGIDVTEIQERENAFVPHHASTPLSQQLHHLLGSHIDGFFTRATLPDIGSNIIPDAVVLCSGLGIVTITEIPIAGIISYSGDPSWSQLDKDNSISFNNACLQAQQAKSALANLLSVHNLIMWPVQSLVVFSHPDVSLNLVPGKQRVQCNVIKLMQLPNWFASKNMDATIRFTKDDYNRFIALLDPARVPIEQAKQA